MPGRIRVNLKPLRRLGVCRRPQQAGATRHRFGVSSGDIVDIQVEVNLLRFTIGPVRRNMVWGELKTETWHTIHVQRVPIVLNLDCALQEACPEGALGGEVRGVEHDDLAERFHRTIKPHLVRGVTEWRDHEYAPDCCQDWHVPRLYLSPARDAASNRWMGVSPLIDTSALLAGCPPVNLSGDPLARTNPENAVVPFPALRFLTHPGLHEKLPAGNGGDAEVRGVSAVLVDPRRFELLTSSMRTRRATNCAKGPYCVATLSLSRLASTQAGRAG